MSLIATATDFSKKFGPFFDRVENFIDFVPCLRTFMGYNYSNVSLFGGCLRWLYETLEDQTPFEQYFEQDKDIDLKVKNVEAFVCMLMHGVSHKGRVEYAGPGYGRVQDEMAESFDFRFRHEPPDGCYFLYIPSKLCESGFIRFDISFMCNVDKVDFFCNGITYPNTNAREQRKYEREIWLATKEIDSRVIHVRNPKTIPKIIWRLIKMYENGYIILGDQDQVSHNMATTFRHMKDTLGSTYVDHIVPPVRTPKDMYMVTPTVTQPVEITKDFVTNHPVIRCIVGDLLENTEKTYAEAVGSQHYLGGLPTEGEGHGVTDQPTTVYKSLLCCFKIDGHIVFKKRIVATLDILEGTRYYRKVENNCLKFRFKKAIVTGFYTYPFDKIDSPNNYFFASDYDTSFEYRIGEIKPRSKYSEKDVACASGIHAFLTPQEAWQWTGAREASDIFIPEDPIFDPKSLVLQQTQQVSQSRQWGFK